MNKILALILTFFLSGCVNTLPAPNFYTGKSINHYLSWTQRKKQLNELHAWLANGNIAIRGINGAGVNSSFSWQQNVTQYQLRLFGPLGTSSILLLGNPQHVTLLTHNQTFTASNAEQLLAQQLNIHLPVSQLYYWLRGLPAPQTRYTMNLDAYNRLMQLRQSGWRISYLHYTNNGKLDIPDRLLLVNPQWKIQILITHWAFSDSSA
jgi:outer membrane lipoprotein LolB